MVVGQKLSAMPARIPLRKLVRNSKVWAIANFRLPCKCCLSSTSFGRTTERSKNMSGLPTSSVLKGHLYRARLRIDRYDPDPRWRGSEIVSGMAGAMILSAVVVCYLFWRHLDNLA